MDNPFEEIREIMAVLVSDALRSYALQGTDVQCSRRIYARSVFALIESLTENLKHIALSSNKLTGNKPSAAEISLLKEETYALTEAGELYKDPKFIDLPRNIRFTYRVSARLFNSDYKLQFDAGWSVFISAFDIFNRVSHPKSTADLQISDSDLDTIDQAHQWYRQVFLDLLRSMNLKLGQSK
jgi:hypothetical protein